VIDLKKIASKIEKLANLHGREVFIESEKPDGEGDFFVSLNDEGTIGAFGRINEKGEEELVFYILDNCKVRYCLNEGWDIDDVYKVMGEKLFLEVSQDNFLEIMTEKKSLDN